LLKPVRTSLARGETKTLRLRFRRQDALTRLLAQNMFAMVRVRAEARTVGVRTSTKKVVRVLIPRIPGSRGVEP
jgi:hypothetical protein